MIATISMGVRKAAGRFCPALGLAALIGIAAAGGSCADIFDPLYATRPDQYKVRNPGILGASATGTGCGFTDKEALAAARKVAHYNLRTETGNASYTIQFRTGERTVESKDRVCVEVTARAVP